MRLEENYLGTRPGKPDITFEQAKKFDTDVFWKCNHGHKVICSYHGMNSFYYDEANDDAKCCCCWATETNDITNDYSHVTAADSLFALDLFAFGGEIQKRLILPKDTYYNVLRYYTNKRVQWKDGENIKKGTVPQFIKELTIEKQEELSKLYEHENNCYPELKNENFEIKKCDTCGGYFIHNNRICQSEELCPLCNRFYMGPSKMWRWLEANEAFDKRLHASMSEDEYLKLLDLDIDDEETEVKIIIHKRLHTEKSATAFEISHRLLKI